VEAGRGEGAGSGAAPTRAADLAALAAVGAVVPGALLLLGGGGGARGGRAVRVALEVDQRLHRLVQAGNAVGAQQPRDELLALGGGLLLVAQLVVGGGLVVPAAGRAAARGGGQPPATGAASRGGEQAHGRGSSGPGLLAPGGDKDADWIRELAARACPSASKLRPQARQRGTGAPGCAAHLPAAAASASGSSGSSASASAEAHQSAPQVRGLPAREERLSASSASASAMARSSEVAGAALRAARGAPAASSPAAAAAPPTLSAAGAGPAGVRRGRHRGLGGAPPARRPLRGAMEAGSRHCGPRAAHRCPPRPTSCTPRR
jgi:hypothetical protein